jgi:hypothetical protein
MVPKTPSAPNWTTVVRRAAPLKRTTTWLSTSDYWGFG